MPELTSIPDVTFAENVALATYSAIRIGGIADLIAFPRTQEAMIALLTVLEESGRRYHVIGNATNVLFDDAGYRGVIVMTGAIRSVRWEKSLLHAEAGASLTALAAEAARRGLAGLEFAYGIPGTVGGAVYMNAGAYGSEISAVLTQSTYLANGKVGVREHAAHAFGYRDSIYRHTGDIILSADFALTPDTPDAVQARSKANMAARRAKQPLEYPNLGSTFKRPAGDFAGRLIEEAGLRGTRIGGAEISTKHAGFLINRGGATSNDVRALVEAVRQTVADRSGILLEPEIIFLPEKE